MTRKQLLQTTLFSLALKLSLKQGTQREQPQSAIIKDPKSACWFGHTRQKRKPLILSVASSFDLSTQAPKFFLLVVAITSFIGFSFRPNQNHTNWREHAISFSFSLIFRSFSIHFTKISARFSISYNSSQFPKTSARFFHCDNSSQFPKTSARFFQSDKSSVLFVRSAGDDGDGDGYEGADGFKLG